MDTIQRLAVLDKYFEKEHLSVSELNKRYHSWYFTEITVNVNKKYAHFLLAERDSFGYVKETVTGETVLIYFNCKTHSTPFVRWFLRFIDVGEII